MIDLWSWTSMIPWETQPSGLAVGAYQATRGVTLSTLGSDLTGDEWEEAPPPIPMAQQKEWLKLMEIWSDHAQLVF